MGGGLVKTVPVSIGTLWRVDSEVFEKKKNAFKESLARNKNNICPQDHKIIQKVCDNLIKSSANCF